MSIVGAPLQAVTEALGEALTEAQVAAAILRTGLQPFGADAGVVTRLSADGSELEILGSVGYTDETAQAWPLIPVQAPLPISESVRKREPLFLSGIELRRFGPVPGLTAQAVVCIPLFARGRMLGALAATFEAEREFPADERQLLVTLGRLCSQALDRARAFERERQSREQAEAAQARLDLLVRASQMLLASLDREESCRGLARLLVPGFCDAFAVDLFEEGRLRRVAEVLRGSWPNAGEQVVETWRLLIDEVDPAFTLAVSREAMNLLPRMAAESAVEQRAPCKQEWPDGACRLSVPLILRDEVLGALTLHRSRICSPQDVLLVTELAARTASALENGRLYAQAREAVRAREDFLSIAGHELRTPITVLKLQLQSSSRLLHEFPERSAGMQRVFERTEKAGRQVDRLATLVDRLLDLSRLNAGRFTLELEVVEFSQLVLDVSARFADEAARAGCALIVETGDTADGRWDRMRLEQLVSNLLSNAVKYGRGRPVHLKVWREGRRAFLRVTDQGIGIALADQHRIFQRFERAGNARDAAGLGLGLWISREIVEAHGGKISVESGAGKGAQFTVELPARDPGPALTPVPPSQQA